MQTRAWAGPDDTTLLQRMASRLWPRGLHPGGLGWAAAIGQLAERVVLAEDDGLVGWAGIDRDGELLLQTEAARPAVAAALVDWALDVAGDRTLTVAVATGDEAVGSVLNDAGFALLAQAPPLVGPAAGMFLDAGDAGDGRARRAPDGYHVRAVRDGELADRLAAHRAAWRPATLPWPEDRRPEVDPDATSRFTAELYEQVRATWLYDQTLDLVVEAPDGTMAACCIAWWDPATRCAEIEPLGVLPEHRRRGLAAALVWEAARQVAVRGGDTVFINVDPDPAYPAPAATYLAAGFEHRLCGHAYRRQAAAG